MNGDDQRRRALYATRLLEYSATIVAAVRDDGPDELRSRIAAALALTPPPGVDNAAALVTVLAAQIDPKATQRDLVGWTESWRPIHVGLPDGIVHDIDVQAVMAGELPGPLASMEARSEAVLRLLARGDTPHDVAARTALSTRTVARIRARDMAGWAPADGQRVAS